MVVAVATHSCPKRKSRLIRLECVVARCCPDNLPDSAVVQSYSAISRPNSNEAFITRGLRMRFEPFGQRESKLWRV